VHRPPTDGCDIFARLIPTFSFGVVSDGAGLTKILHKTFALVTLFGMAPPTFAYTDLGSSVVSAQWPSIVAGGRWSGSFLAMPKLLLKYRTSAFAHLFLGPTSVPTLVATRREEIPLQVRCSGYGAAMPTA
jgi:hypothetical protein